MRLCNCYELEDNILIEDNGVYQVFTPPVKKFIPQEDERFYYVNDELNVTFSCNCKENKYNFEVIKPFKTKNDALGYKMILELLLEHTLSNAELHKYLLDTSYNIHALAYNVSTDDLMMINIKDVNETLKYIKKNDVILFSSYYFSYAKNLNKILDIANKDMIKKYVFDIWE